MNLIVGVFSGTILAKSAQSEQKTNPGRLRAGRKSGEHLVQKKESEGLEMSMGNGATSTWKLAAIQDLKDFGAISLYLACFFSALATYTMLLLKEYGASSVLNYSFALINALVVAKVILIAEMAHLGKTPKDRPLYQVAIYKAFIYCLVVLAFHFAEEFVKRLIHRDAFGTVWHEIRIDDLVGRSVVIFCAFVPLFAFRELRNLLGIEKFNSLIYKGGAHE